MNTIGDILRKRGVIGRGMLLDTEYSCTYVSFTSEAVGKLFIKRLNALPEVFNYKAPKPSHIMMAAKDWERLNATLKKMLTTEQREQLSALGIMIEPIFNYSEGGYN